MIRAGMVLAVLAVGAVAQIGSPPPGYAVVVSKRTMQDAGWMAVVDALVARHGGHVVPFEGAVTMARAGLTPPPGRTAFVLRPEEAGRQAVLDIHRMTRVLDDDPYTDTLWGIVTGYTAEAALRLVAPETPLLIERATAGFEIDLDVVAEGAWYSEFESGLSKAKARGGAPVLRTDGPQDSVAALAKGFSSSQLILTSGHATERDWQPGYRYKNGSFRCADGELFGLDMKRGRHPVRSTDPKIYLAAGNCLMGHVDGKDAMALAFMNTAGVRQLVGYTVVTWYGAGGWGTRDRLMKEPGRRSFVDAWFSNNQAISWRLHQEFPRTVDVRFDDWLDIRKAMGKTRAAAGEYQRKDGLRENTGLLWDRDTVAFFGDPGYACRLAPREEAWTSTLSRQGSTWTLTVHATRAAEPGGRIFHWLPERVGDVRIAVGSEHRPVVTDGFIMLPAVRELAAGETLVVRFDAAPLPAAGAAVTTRPVAPSSGSKAPRRKVALAAALGRVPDAVLGLENVRARVTERLALAGANRTELLDALARCPEGELPGLAWLLLGMPESDLRTLGRGFLLDNVTHAYKAWQSAPWSHRLPEEMFFDHVLPYANVNERRDAWRGDFHRRFAEVVKDAKTPREAMGLLNVAAFKTFGVSYHPSKRPKPDQSPYESIEAGYASCTGLSIMLIDACRAIGVPARFVGTPRWTTVNGNHSWVEVFDREWLVIGACEPGQPNRTWFMGRAAQADPTKAINRIYAVDWRGGDRPFPLVWARGNKDVNAVDVTRSYTHRRKVRLAVRTSGEDRATAVTLRRNGRIVAHVAVGEQPSVLTLAGDTAYDAEVTCAVGADAVLRRATVRTTDAAEQDLVITVE